MTTTSQSLQPGVILRHDTYRIERVIGQGGFGITYLATDLSLAKYVAVKEFFPRDYCDRDETSTQVTLGTQGSKEFVTRLKAKFLKEARNIAKFDHPGIIKIHAAFEENNTAYYVMDYIQGMSLSEIVKARGPLESSKAAWYVSKVGEALEYVHARGMNHLDVKPANIMVRESDDRPVLIDFGLAKQYDASGQQTSTTPLGISHGFAPVEQYSDGGVKEFSPQADVYSLAATAYYLMSGIIPPQSTRLIDEELTFPAAIPQAMVGPIAKAMSVRKSQRQSTVGQFIAEMQVMPQPRQGLPLVRWFCADQPMPVAAGTRLKLMWRVDYADKVTVDGVAMAPEQNSTWIVVRDNATVTLSAFNHYGKTEQTVSIRVSSIKTPQTAKSKSPVASIGVIIAVSVTFFICLMLALAQ